MSKMLLDRSKAKESYFLKVASATSGLKCKRAENCKHGEWGSGASCTTASPPTSTGEWGDESLDEWAGRLAGVHGACSGAGNGHWAVNAVCNSVVGSVSIVIRAGNN